MHLHIQEIKNFRKRKTLETRRTEDICYTKQCLALFALTKYTLFIRNYDTGHARQLQEWSKIIRQIAIKTAKGWEWRIPSTFNILSRRCREEKQRQLGEPGLTGHEVVWRDGSNYGEKVSPSSLCRRASRGCCERRAIVPRLSCYCVSREREGRTVARQKVGGLVSRIYDSLFLQN